MCYLVNDDSDWFVLFGFGQAAVECKRMLAEKAEPRPFAEKIDEQQERAKVDGWGLT